MLTFFTTAKPFEGHSGVIQRNALRSWKLLHPDVEVIVFGDEPGVAEVCAEYGLRHEPHVERHESGLKYVNYMFERAQKIARHDFLCYSNCDIIFTNDFLRAFERVALWKRPFLLAGQRWDISLTEPWNFGAPAWDQRLMELVERSGSQRPPYWIDYFLFSRGVFADIPPLVIGRVGWDQWLIWKARSVKTAVVNASAVVRAAHQNHDYSYHPAGARGVWCDEQAARNRELGGGHWHLYTLEDATHTLTQDGIRYNWFHRWPPLRRRMRPWFIHIWFWILGLTRPLRHRLGLRKGARSQGAGAARIGHGTRRPVSKSET